MPDMELLVVMPFLIFYLKNGKMAKAEGESTC